MTRRGDAKRMQLETAPSRTVTLAMAATSAGACGLAALLWFTPEMATVAVLNVEGTREFVRAIVGEPPRPMDGAAFATIFRLLLAATWFAWGLLVLAGLRWGAPGLRRALPWVAVVALALALAGPPALSRDVHGYAAFARMPVAHGVNPYQQTPFDVISVEPAAALYPVPSPTPYGPIWTLLSMALVLPLGAGTWGLSVAFKLVAAIALIVAAFAGRALASTYSEGRGDIAFVAIGLNPLLLIEGPLSGHNDLLLAALVLGASAAAARGRPRVGYLLVGLSAGIKYVSLALLPWLVIEALRRERFSWKRAAHESLWALSALAVPLLAYAPFLDGRSPLDGLLGAWSLQSADPPGVALGGAIAALWLGLTAWVALCRDRARHLAAWAAFSCAVVFALSPVPFAWYLAWPAAAALARWDRVHGAVTCLCLGAAYLLQMAYVLPR